MAALHFEARERFRVPPEKLWPLVSDTHRLNRAMGLPVMRFRPAPLPSGGSRMIGDHPVGSALLGLLAQLFPLHPRRVSDERILRWLPRWPIARWIEHPFKFEAPRRYSILREYFWTPLGLFPLKSARATVELLPTEDGGTEVVASSDVEPLNALSRPMAVLIAGPRSCRKVLRQCRNAEAYLLGEAAAPFPDLLAGEAGGKVVPSEPSGAPTAVRPDAVDAWGRLLRSGVRPEIAARLRQHLESAPDDDVLKMRAFELADRWGVERRETLIACLHATTAGLLDMSWEVLCPGCRLSSCSAASLDQVRGEAHCDLCNITYDASIDRQVEVRFSVAESVRHVEDRRFCTGGPMNIPHVLAQDEIPPGGTGVFDLPLRPGTFRVRSLQSRRTAIIEVQADAPPGRTEVALTLSADAITPPAVAAAPGSVGVSVANQAGVPALVVLEDPGWPDTAATASLVSTIQEFRDLFDAQVLSPGLQLAIQRLTFLFTDLTGSTALYHRVGQGRAFRLVQDHFELLFGAVTACRGAVVKTIGDAVMASFPTGADAVAAALEMQRRIRRLETDGHVDPARLLKVGIHEGPCIAVTANGRLDYFGTTINTASRVEHECRGGQIVLTDEVHRDPAVQELLRREGVAVESAPAQLRGLTEPIVVHRVELPVGEPARPLAVG